MSWKAGQPAVRACGLVPKRSEESACCPAGVEKWQSRQSAHFGLELLITAQPFIPGELTHVVAAIPLPRYHGPLLRHTGKRAVRYFAGGIILRNRDRSTIWTTFDVYNHALEVSYPPYSNVNQFCLASTTSLIFQPNLLDPGSYVFVTNASKVISGVERVTSTSLYVTVLAGSEVDAGRNPLLAVFLDSPQALPVFPGSTIRLRGEVTNPQNDTTYTFVWSAYRFGLNPQYNSETASVDPNYAAELSAVEFNISNQQEVRTPSDSKYLVIAPDVLWPGATYKLRITALDSFMQSQDLQELSPGIGFTNRDASGYAEYTFRTTGLPPSGNQVVHTVFSPVENQTQSETCAKASNLSGNALETASGPSLKSIVIQVLLLFMRYQFSYIQDFESQFAEPGLVGSQNLLRLIGTVKSAVGAVATAYVDVSVNPPSQAAIDSLVAEVPNLDPETAIVYTTLYPACN
eukprot:s5243_g2.t1